MFITNITWRRLTLALPAALSSYVNIYLNHKICSKQNITNFKRIIILLYITDPDCYKLVSISEDRSSTKKGPPTTIGTTTNEPSFL